MEKSDNRVIANSVFNLMRRLPPLSVRKSLAGFATLIEDQTLMQQIFDQVDQPLETATDENTGRIYLKHEYNTDGDSNRSPWTNKYYPETDSSFYPSPQLLQLEQKANAIFAQYVKLYYDNAVSSVYLVDTPEPGFNACFLVKKEILGQQDVNLVCWDSIHVVTCNLKNAPQAVYKVISTVMLTIDANQHDVGNFKISGSCSKTSDANVNLPPDFGTPKCDGDHFHLKTVGKMIEENEKQLRNDAVENYINRQRQITNTARLMDEYMTRNEKQKFQMAEAASKNK